jgi:hypothetical protein
VFMVDFVGFQHDLICGWVWLNPIPNVSKGDTCSGSRT